MKVKKTTYTKLVMDYLVGADDFRTLYQIKEDLNITGQQVSATLCHLFNHKAVDVLSANNELHWFATPENDDRCWSVNENNVETRRNRKEGHHVRRKRNELPKRK
jgi:hypothetical protein